MDVGHLYGRGMAFPPHVGADGRIAWSEGDANIREAIEIILSTERRERIQLPSFGAGLRRYLFEQNSVATRSRIEEEITRALQEWEPRIHVGAVEVEQDARDPQSAVATIHYELVATRAPAQTTVTVRVAG